MEMLCLWTSWHFTSIAVVCSFSSLIYTYVYLISAVRFHNIFTKSHYNWSSLVTWVFVIITIHSIFASKEKRKQQRQNYRQPTKSFDHSAFILCLLLIHSLHLLFLFRIAIEYNEAMVKIKQKRPSTKIKPNKKKKYN